MMEWIRLTDVENEYFKGAWEIYEQSFPIFEQRLLSDQEKAMQHEDFHFMAIVEDNNVVAMIGFWGPKPTEQVSATNGVINGRQFQYVEHLAVHPSMRGRQIGTKVLNQLAEEGKTIILEIDPPVDSISINRLHFYEKVGFKLNDYDHVHPPYRQGNHGHDLKVLSYGQTISDETFEAFNHYLKNTVMQFAQK